MTRNMSQPTAATTASPASSVQQQQQPQQQQLPSIRFVPHHDPRAHRPSLNFTAITRTLPNGDAVIRVGRYSERDNIAEPKPNVPSAAPVGFKSKVVSRRHCEFWYQNSQWFIRDVKSSSGTFLNHLRLSPPGVESKPWPVNDGDVVQLGIDFRGGEEMIFRCVKIRVEVNRGWQKAINPFNKSTHKKLRKLGDNKKRDSDSASLNSTDCTICLMSISPCQSLFVAPCSHVWHYKCIRPILQGPSYPNLTCPNCRATHDVEADIEDDDSPWEEAESEDIQSAIEASKHAGSQTGIDRDGDSPMVDAPVAQAAAPSRAAPSPPTAAERNQHDALSRNQSLAHAIHDNNFLSPGTSGTTPPRNIPLRAPNGVNGTNEGPMTPRNDAGPFVLDGGAQAQGGRN